MRSYLDKSIACLLWITFLCCKESYSQPLNIRLHQALSEIKAYADSIDPLDNYPKYAEGKISRFIPCLDLFLFPGERKTNGDSSLVDSRFLFMAMSKREKAYRDTSLSEKRFLSEWSNYVYLAPPSNRAQYIIYNRSYLDSLLCEDSLPIGLEASIERNIVIQESNPDAIFFFYLLYYGDSARYWNVEDFYFQIMDSMWLSVPLPKPVIGKKGRRNRYPFVMEDPTLVAVSAAKWLLLLKGDSLFVANPFGSGDFEIGVYPLQTFLDSICPFFVARLNSLTRENFIPESERRRMALATDWYWERYWLSRYYDAKMHATKGRMIYLDGFPQKNSEGCF